MECTRCKERGKDWQGDNPRCAFPDEMEFNPDNWNCATMNALREMAEGRSVWSDDQNAALIPFEGSFVVLGWYKNRGCTEFAHVLEGDMMVPLRYGVADCILRES